MKIVRLDTSIVACDSIWLSEVGARRALKAQVNADYYLAEKINCENNLLLSSTQVIEQKSINKRLKWRLFWRTVEMVTLGAALTYELVK